MAVDFGKVFGFALKYSLRKDVFFMLLAVQLIFSLPTWFMTGYLVGDISGIEGIEAFGKFISSMLYLAPIIIVGWIIGIFLMGVYFDNSAKFYRGKRKPVLDSLKAGKERFLPLLATLVILGLIFMACFGGIFLFLFIFPFLESQAGILLLIISGIWFLVGSIIAVVVFFMTFLAPVFCVLEKERPLNSIKKSWNLIGKNKLNTFLFLIIFFVIYMVILMVGSIPETIFILMTGEPSLLSVQSLSFLVFRTFFTVYSILFAYSSDVNYYLSIKKRTGVF